MSLQWAVVAAVLYAEIVAVLLLCIPLISPKRWQKIFKSRLVQLLVSHGNAFFVVLVLQALLLLDAGREIFKYEDGAGKVSWRSNPSALQHLHTKLFRAQRNLHVAGFSLLLSFPLRRLVSLISQQATLLASNEAFKKQAEGASKAAKQYIEENEKLKKEAGASNGKSDPRDDVLVENTTLKTELRKLREELATSKRNLKRAENEALAMRKQSEGLAKDYDRLLEEHAHLQAAVDGPTDKKEQ